jgi:hypothetical protein
MNFSDKAVCDFEMKLDKEEETTEKSDDAGNKKEVTGKKAKKKEESWKLLLNSNDPGFGGEGEKAAAELKSRERIMSLDLPAYSGLIYEVVK